MVKTKLPEVALSWLILALVVSLVILALPMAKPAEAA